MNTMRILFKYFYIKALSKEKCKPRVIKKVKEKYFKNFIVYDFIKLWRRFEILQNLVDFIHNCKYYIPTKKKKGKQAQRKIL